MLGKIEGKRRRQRMKWLHSFTDSMDMNLTNLQEIEDREPWRAAVHRISKSQIQLKTSKTFLLENNHIHSYIICGPVHPTKSELSHIYIDHMGLPIASVHLEPPLKFHGLLHSRDNSHHKKRIGIIIIRIIENLQCTVHIFGGMN